MTKFRGLGYNTRRIHSINIRGKYFRKTFLEAFSDFSRLSVIVVVSVEVLAISFPYGHSIENSYSDPGESRQI